MSTSRQLAAIMFTDIVGYNDRKNFVTTAVQWVEYMLVEK